METSSWNAVVRQNINFLIFTKRALVMLLELWWKIWQIQISLKNVDTYIVPILQYTNVN